MDATSSGVRVTGKNLDIGDSLRDRPRKGSTTRFRNTSRRRLPHRVTVEKKHGLPADCTFYLDTGAVIARLRLCH